MSPLAQMLLMKVTPLSQWSPATQIKKRASDVKRKKFHKSKIDSVCDILTKPLTTKQIAEKTGYTQDLCQKYVLILREEGRIQRSQKAPYTYWKL